MKFKPSTHPDFELELFQDGMIFLAGYLNNPDEFKEFSKKTGVFPYIFDIDREFNMVSRKPGIVSWKDEYPGWESVESWDELMGIVLPRLINNGTLTPGKYDDFIKKFWFGLDSELHLINGLNVVRVSRESVQYGSFYQGVKLV